MSEPVDAEDGPMGLSVERSVDPTSGPRDPGDSVPGPGDPVPAPSDEDLAYQQRLGARLRAIRRAQGLRLQDVEIRSDGRFKAVVIGSYERGDRAVSAHRLAALAAFYEVPVSELLPEDHWPRSNARGSGVRLAVDRLRAASPDPELAPLHRLVQHVQWLRGDYNGRVLSLRGDDLQTVAIALGIDPDELGGWLAERDLLAAV
jgi:transcriptional regulator with XRE-family HTH domain